MTSDEKIHRGRRAAEILGDELVTEALAAMREKIIADWQGTAIGGREEREVLYFLHCGMVEFEAHFRSLIDGGKVAVADNERAEAERKAEAS